MLCICVSHVEEEMYLIKNSYPGTFMMISVIYFYLQISQNVLWREGKEPRYFWGITIDNKFGTRASDQVSTIFCTS